MICESDWLPLGIAFPYVLAGTLRDTTGSSMVLEYFIATMLKLLALLVAGVIVSVTIYGRSQCTRPQVPHCHSQP